MHRGILYLFEDAETVVLMRGYWPLNHVASEMWRGGERSERMLRSRGWASEQGTVEDGAVFQLGTGILGGR